MFNSLTPRLVLIGVVAVAVGVGPNGAEAGHCKFDLRYAFTDIALGNRQAATDTFEAVHRHGFRVNTNLAGSTGRFGLFSLESGN